MENLTKSGRFTVELSFGGSDRLTLTWSLSPRKAAGYAGYVYLVALHGAG